MVKRLAFLLFFAAVTFCAPRAFAESLQELAIKTKPSVVLLVISNAAGVKTGTGTGFFVSTDGKVVTNHHVVEGAAKVTANLSDGRKIVALGLLADDEEKDLAILKLPGDGYPALALGDSRPLRQGDEVVVIGSPMGLSGTLSAGIISAIRDGRMPAADDDDDEPGDKKGAKGDKSEKKPKAWAIQITAAVSPGSSGSPILTLGGEVIAVAVGMVGRGGSLNFGVPIEEAKVLLARAGPGVAPRPFTQATGADDVRKNLTISAGLFVAVLLIYFAVKGFDRLKQRRRDRDRAARLRH